MAAKKQRKVQRARGWCTLYALTKGIYPVNVEFRASPYGSSYPPRLWVDMGDLRVFHPTLSEGFTFFRTRKDASANARQQAEDLIVQLKIRIAKAEAMRSTPKFLTSMPKTARLPW